MTSRGHFMPLSGVKDVLSGLCSYYDVNNKNFLAGLALSCLVVQTTAAVVLTRYSKLIQSEPNADGTPRQAYSNASLVTSTEFVKFIASLLLIFIFDSNVPATMATVGAGIKSAEAGVVEMVGVPLAALPSFQGDDGLGEKRGLRNNDELRRVVLVESDADDCGEMGSGGEEDGGSFNLLAGDDREGTNVIVIVDRVAPTALGKEVGWDEQHQRCNDQHTFKASTRDGEKDTLVEGLSAPTSPLCATTAHQSSTTTSGKTSLASLSALRPHALPPFFAGWPKNKEKLQSAMKLRYAAWVEKLQSAMKLRYAAWVEKLQSGMKLRYAAWMEKLQSGIQGELFSDLKCAMKVSVPALLYTVQNNVIYIALDNLDATTFQVGYQSKVVTTAILSVLMLNRSLSYVKWVALFVLTLGIVLTQLQPVASSSSSRYRSDADLTKGLLAVMTASCCSAFAGVYFEKILKDTSPTVWVRNAQLAFFSLVIGFCGYLYTLAYSSSSPSPSSSVFDGFSSSGDASVLMWGIRMFSKFIADYFRGYDGLAVVIIVVQAIGGLIIACTVKYADNILKGFATATSIVLCGILSAMFMGMIPNAMFVMGCMVVIAATILYSRP